MKRLATRHDAPRKVPSKRCTGMLPFFSNWLAFPDSTSAMLLQMDGFSATMSTVGIFLFLAGRSVCSVMRPLPSAGAQGGVDQGSGLLAGGE